jgi:hypothetical protein
VANNIRLHRNSKKVWPLVVFEARPQLNIRKIAGSSAPIFSAALGIATKNGVRHGATDERVQEMDKNAWFSEGSTSSRPDTLLT